MQKIQIYTDGSCSKNPGPGGWAALLISNNREMIISGREMDTTNNKMELRSVIEGLSRLKYPSIIEVFSDSKYVICGITNWIHQWQVNNWKTSSKNPVGNQELWKQLIISSKTHQINWNWIKAHSGHPKNELVDKIAKKEALLASLHN